MPDQTQLFIVAIAGHGMQMDGRQVVLVNEFNKRTKYYQIFGVESMVRDKAKSNPNSYWIAIFACCREIHNTQKHSGLFGGSELQAIVHFDTKAYDDFVAKGNQLTPAKAEALQRLNQTLLEKLYQFKEIELDKINHIGKCGKVC